MEFGLRGTNISVVWREAQARARYWTIAGVFARQTERSCPTLPTNRLGFGVQRLEGGFRLQV